jgi:hypothetical protein
MDAAAPGDRPTTNAKGERPNHEQAYYTCPRMGEIAGLSFAVLLAIGMSAVVPAALPVNQQDSVRSLYDTLLCTMKDGRRLGQSGRYARLAPAEYIVSADSSCLTPQRGYTERYQSNSSTSPRS